MKFAVLIRVGLSNDEYHYRVTMMRPWSHGAISLHSKNTKHGPTGIKMLQTLRSAYTNACIERIQTNHRSCTSMLLLW